MVRLTDLKRDRARRLRRETTGVERILWSKLNNRQLGGHKFARQEPIGSYVADFLCREQRPIVELDGGQHAESSRDVLRDEFLTLNGYRVKRFWNGEVRENLDGVLLTILHLLGGERQDLNEEKPPLTLTLSPQAGNRIPGPTPRCGIAGDADRSPRTPLAGRGLG